MRLSISHTTRYHYEQPPLHGLQRLRLRPKPTHGQQVHEWAMTLAGAKLETEYDDHHANHIALISVESGAHLLEITCKGVVETADRSGIVGPHTGSMPLWAYLRQTPLTKPGPKMRSLFGPRHGAQDRLGLLHELSAAVLETMAYSIGTTDVTTTAEQALSGGSGVCQDHAHVFIGCARALGIPARYVSGYLMLKDRVDQEAGHGWAEAHVDGLGWVGFDVSNGIAPDASYVRVASGFDYRDAAPITGISWGAGNADMAITLAVEQQTIEQ
ncbi:MAG: transglutaminase domain-containing protein [Novosphingobium sp.]